MNYKEKHLRSILNAPNFDKLLLFYTPYFNDQDSCIDYLFSVLRYEPTHTVGLYEGDLCALDINGKVVIDDVFIPKRMLNAVQRFVSVAKDIDTIRPGDDPFKIIFLITCIESLQTLRGKTFKTKRNMIIDFFDTFTSIADSEFISNHFESIPEDFYDMPKSGPVVLAEALYAIRNAAVHNGDCWDLLFPDSNMGLLINVSDKKRQSLHKGYINAISYSKFEHIFVRTCMNLISHYVSAECNL